MTTPVVEPAPGARLRPLWFAGLVLAWCGLFAYLATLEPTLHDGWWHRLELARRPLSPSSLADFVADQYQHGNPRLGQWLTYVAFAPGLWHPLLAALGAASVPLFVFVLAYARLPRPDARGDVARLAAIAGLLFVCIPNPGQMFCYRPFTGNYVWAFAFTLALVAPYRLALARPPGPRRTRGWTAAAAAGMALLGVAAGMANEHTGPVAIAALALATALLYRRDGRVRGWTVAGVIGLAAGTALLLGAPGQSERYHGLADASSLVGTVVERGAAGNVTIVAKSLLYTVVSWLLLAAALLATRRARGAAGRWRTDVAILIAAALAIVATVLVSPKQGPRLFYAPAVLLLAAAVRALDEAITGRAARALAVAIAAGIALAGAAQLVRVEREAHADFEVRLDRLAHAAPGSIAPVPPFRRFTRGWWNGWWTFGDDFRSAPLRQRVAVALFDLDDVVLDTRDPQVLAGAGVTLALDSDLAPRPARATADPAEHDFSEQIFTPDGLWRALGHFRDAVGTWSSRPGTHLTRAALRVVGLDAPALAGRPLLFASWTAAGGFVLPTAERAPAGSLWLRAGGDATTIAAPVAIDELARGATPGGYLVVTCDPQQCHVLAARHH